MIPLSILMLYVQDLWVLFNFPKATQHAYSLRESLSSSLSEFYEFLNKNFEWTATLECAPLSTVLVVLACSCFYGYGR